jgi:hypothetical protein
VRQLTAEEVRRVEAVASGTAANEPSLHLPARRHGHAAPCFEVERDEEGLPLVPQAPKPPPKNRSTPERKGPPRKASGDRKPPTGERPRTRR